MWNFMTGYVIIEVRSANMERVFEVIAKKRIALRELRRISYSAATVCLSPYGYVRLMHIAGKLPADIKTLKTGGVCSLAAFVRRRTALIIMCCAAIAGVALAGNVCTGIRINGAGKLNEFMLYDTVKKNAPDGAALKSSVDLGGIEKAVKNAYPSVIYAKAYFDGGILTVDIVEGDSAPKTENTAPCSIAAKKGGVIKKMTVKEGMAVKKPGDVVHAGEILIAGEYEKNEKSYDVAASGEVLADIDYFGSGSALYGGDDMAETGRSTVERWMRLGKACFRLDGRNHFAASNVRYDKIIKVGENMPLCMEIIDIRFYETKKAVRDAEKLKTEAREKAYYAALTNAGDDAEIIDFRTETTKTGDGLRAEAVLTVEEDIAGKYYGG